MIGFRMGERLQDGTLKVGQQAAKGKGPGVHRVGRANAGGYDPAKRSDSPWLAVSNSPKARAGISR
jgi:hypothetical protein